MKICPNKHTMPNGENFPDMFAACPICGTALVDEMQNVQPVCKKCGLQLEKGWKVCPACCTPVNDNSSIGIIHNSAIPADVLELLERRHELRKLHLYTEEKLAELGKIDIELNKKNQLINYIDMEKKFPNAELEDYIGDQSEEIEEQYDWWIKSADNGCVEDCSSAYIAYWHGYGREQDIEKAWDYLEKGVAGGDYDCIARMAEGLYPPSDKDKYNKFVDLIKLLINCEVPYYAKKGYRILGNLAYDDEEYEEAFENFEKAFELGSGVAGVKLARMYKDGLGVEPDTDNAMFVYKKIINEKIGDASINAIAAYELGEIYSTDIEDKDSAFKCFKMAADLGHEMSFLMVANCYSYGTGIEPDSKKSLYWMKKACDSEDDFISGKGYELLGNCYCYPENDCEEDPYKAFEYYKIAAEKDNPWAQYMVGLFYDNGKYVEQSYKKAVYWYKKALKSDENNLPAKYNLGQSYYYGTGVNVDENYGLQLIQEAADGGYEPAEEWLKENT